jgi:TorA maturation chaperone TorD
MVGIPHLQSAAGTLSSIKRRLSDAAREQWQRLFSHNTCSAAALNGS